jgi:hypothetical protein
LILQERQQRGHDDGRPREEQRRQLIAEGFAAARRKDEQDVASREYAGDGPLLIAVQARESEPLTRQVAHQVDARLRRGL